MNKLLLIITALLFSIAACKKDDNTGGNNIRFCPNIYAQYSYENNGDTAYCWVPNVFTPEGNGNNDVWYFYSRNLASINARVKSGNTTVFYTENFNEGWDGRINGQLAAQKNYDYTISGADIFGNSFNLVGTVSVLDSIGMDCNMILPCQRMNF